MTHPQEPARDRNLDPIAEAPGAPRSARASVPRAVQSPARPLAPSAVSSARRWAVGAVVGGLAGKGGAEAVNPTDEDAYWRDAHGREPYYSDAYTYEDHAPPYRHGYQSVIDGRSEWNEVRSDLRQRCDADRQSSR